jgi:calcium permeable stress-gated cation channel
MSDITDILNGTFNGAAGSAQSKKGTTISTFAISLAVGFILFVVQATIFLIIRNYLWAKRIYQPRSFLVPVKQRIKPPQNNPFKWLRTVFKIQEDPEVLHKAGMDAYFFLRFLSMCLKMFTPMALIIIPILIPLNVKNGKGTNTINGVQYNVTGLDTLAWSNVSPAHTNRYWTHLVLAVGVVLWVCFIIHQELIHYIGKREEYLASPAHRLKASSTTVLVQDIPEKICNEEALEEMYGDFPGGIRRIWINRDFTVLVNKDKARRKYEDKLENAETDMLRKAIKQGHKINKINKKGAPKDKTTSEQQTLSDAATPAICERDLEYDLETKAAWTNYLTPKQRPTMRIPKDKHTAAAKIPLIGRFFSTKVDTIYYCRRELARLNKEIDSDIETSDAYPDNRSAFIQFNSQKAAHLACQSVADTAPRHMRKRIVEISPGDINWPSLNLSWRARYIRFMGFFLLFILLVFAFGLISFFTGILSRISDLAGSTPWLRWIENLPTWLLSFIQGTLPPIIQVVVLSGPLPILLRLLTNKMRGATTGQEGEHSLQLWYFIFLFLELFIVPTISSGLTTIVYELIHNPTTVSNILATDFPTAADYYFSFLILQALSLSATALLQTIRLFKYYVFGHVNTPDSVFQKLSWTNLTRIGSNIPWYTTFAVIGMFHFMIHAF